MADLPDAPPATLIAAVEGAVGRAPGGSVTRWQALRGGRTNVLWRVDTDRGACAVKVYNPGAATPLFPNDPQAEWSVLQALTGQAVAPGPQDLITGAFGTALIYTFMQGATWRAEPAPLADLLFRVHQNPAPDGLRHLPSGSKELIRQARQILSACPPCPEDVSRAMAQLPDLPEVPPSQAETLIHCDPVASNVIETSGGLSLIDWQCPARGDPCEDLAIVLSPFMQRAYLGRTLRAEAQAAFLRAYPDQAIAARYRLLAPFFHARMAAYAWWCLASGRGATDADIEAELSAMRVADRLRS